MKMKHLAIKGDVKKGPKIISLLKDMGAGNLWSYRGDNPGWVYTMGSLNTSDIRAFPFHAVKDSPQFCIFSYDDFMCHYPLRPGHDVDVPGNFEKGKVLEMAWSENAGDMMYKVEIRGHSVPNGGMGWWYWSDLNVGKEKGSAVWGNNMKAQESDQPQYVAPVMDFGNAINLLKNGYKVTRLGWNGKGMFLWLKPAATIKSEWCKDPVLKGIVDAAGGQTEALGTICMKTADGKVLTGWIASQTDMLAEDWVVVV